MSKDPIFPSPEKMLEAFDFASVMAEKDQEHEAQLRAVLLSMLEVADSFDRFFAPLESRPAEVSEPAQSWLKTFRLIRKQLELALNKAGVMPIQCLGRPADPELHEIVEVKEKAEVEEGLIVEEVRRGYEWKGTLLRRPQVAVAK